MTVLYPEYWKMYKCQLRKGGWQQNKEQPNVKTRTEDTIKFAAAHYNAEILKSIDNEWRKTQCMPREVCIDVGKEFGAATNTFFKPPCVSVYRCGGCCNSEGLQCMNTSTGYLSKTFGSRIFTADVQTCSPLVEEEAGCQRPRLGADDHHGMLFKMMYDIGLCMYLEKPSPQL
ncbi:Vascular endothelial growth factor C [Pteropus alecto]|uniref:Vascular endothelial growth factor C n=1 Tax=Pteropus alecto TaxID=9402 RepID=L5KBT4_PTEAL|nr:Vascular endothelial growth factor C [Pteropus alecto]